MRIVLLTFLTLFLIGAQANNQLAEPPENGMVVSVPVPERQLKPGRKTKRDKNNKKKPTTGPPSTSPVEFSSSPTSVDSIAVSSSVNIMYSKLSKNTPTFGNYEELTLATQKYLEEFMMIKLTGMDNFVTKRRFEFFYDKIIDVVSIIIVYDSTGRFNPDSNFIPVTRDIDNLIDDALGSEDYLKLMQSLSESNPFRETGFITLVPFIEPAELSLLCNEFRLVLRFLW
jgi:hypothetical protein